MRKLVLLSAVALAGMAMAAPSPAFGVIEVSDEAEAEHCSAVEVSAHVVSGGCEIHVSSSGTVRLATEGGITVSVCDNEFDANVDETAYGYVHNQVLSGASCFMAPCVETGTSTKEEWEVLGIEDDSDLTLATTFCVAPVGSPTSKTFCSITLAISDLGGHSYEFSSPDNHCADPIDAEITSADWLVEDTNIEIGHAELEGEVARDPKVLDFKDGAVGTELEVEFTNNINATVKILNESIIGSMVRFTTNGGCTAKKTLSKGQKCKVK